MDCQRFQDSITDYLDGAIDSRTRAESAAHRLICRECRELYNDVRSTIQALNAVGQREIDSSEEVEELENRIIAATTAGEMLSCSDFDKIIERYFDGVVLAPTFQTFQAHFEKCGACRRLMAGIEDAIAMCREIKETEVEVPDSLHDRIVAATVGAHAERQNSWGKRALGSFVALGAIWFRSLWTPQMAVAALIFASSSLLILSRFGSVGGMASQAEAQAEILVNQGHRAINQTGAMARVGFQRVSYEFNMLWAGNPVSPTSTGVTVPLDDHGPAPVKRAQPKPGSKTDSPLDRHKQGESEKEQRHFGKN